MSSVVEQPQTTKKHGGCQPGRALRYAKGSARGLLHQAAGHFLSWGHIVLYRFPVRLPGEDDRPKARPCLILETLVLATRPYAVIAYGTSAETRANRGYDVDVKGAEAADAGLDRDSRFVCARRLIVALDSPGFIRVRHSGSPVIGRIGGRALARMNSVRARIIAEADIAADRREQRRASTGRPFQLERKGRSRLVGATGN